VRVHAASAVGPVLRPETPVAQPKKYFAAIEDALHELRIVDIAHAPA
jgi:hypothetical protein